MRARLVPLLAASFAVVASLGAVGVRAQTPASGVRLDVVRGYDGRARGYSPNPITIAVESDRIFSGTIEVEVPTGQMLEFYRRSIEVPGGSRKVIRFVVPRATVNQVRALDGRGEIVASATPNANVLDSGESLVGVLSSIPLAFDSVRIAGLDRPAEVVPVAAEMVDLGAIALNPLSHLVVDAAVVRLLSQTQIDSITGYAAAGGELVVAADGESALSFLPAAWRGTGGGSVRRTSTSAGAVTVALEPITGAGWGSSGSMWSQTLRPVNILRWSSTSTNSLAAASSQNGGFRGASLGWLLTFLIVYVVLVGPVGFIVLSRMRRRELAWVVIPAVAVLFAVGAFVAGRGFRSGPIKRGIAIAVVQPGSERVTAAIGLLSRGGGVEKLTVSDDWIVDTSVTHGGEPPRVMFSGRDARAEIPLAVGDIGRAIISRARTADHKAAGSILLARSGLTAEVRNVGGLDLRSATIVTGQASTPIGDLPSGGTYKGPVESGGLGFEEDPYGYRYGYGGFENDEARLLSFIGRTIAGSGRRGAAYLAGTADLAEAGPAFGLPAVPGTILIMMPLDVRSNGGVDVDASVVSPELISTDAPITSNPFGDAGNFSGKEFSIRFTLPPGARPRSLYLGGHGLQQYAIKDKARSVRVGVPVVALSYFDPSTGSWRALTERVGDVMSVPASALGAGGDVLVRISAAFQGEIAPYAFTLGGRA